jgi:hypothetical protein
LPKLAGKYSGKMVTVQNTTTGQTHLKACIGNATEKNKMPALKSGSAGILNIDVPVC